ncbi:3539_t:CDS:2, partial [Entrophospora sp. SA101]
MKKITLLSPLLKTPKEIDNYVSQNFGSNDTASPEYIKASWFAIANLYFTAHDYNKAEKFLLQLLYYQPNDIKANELLAIVYRKHDNLESALEYYESSCSSSSYNNNNNLEKLLDEYIDQVEKWEETSLLNPQTLGQWSKYRKEYKSRILRHDDKNQILLNNAYEDFKSCLSYKIDKFPDPSSSAYPPTTINHFVYLMCQRLSDVSHRFLTLLMCFDYNWLNNEKKYNQKILRSQIISNNEEGNNLTESYGKDLIKKEELDLLKWMSKYSHQFDMIAICCAPYDLKR